MQFDRIDIDATGDYKRGSVTLALCGPMRISIHFAANALGIHLPINSHRQLYTFPHPSLDVARNLAVEAWLLQRKEFIAHGKPWAASRHLFVWSVDSLIKWNAIIECMATDHAVIQIGQGPGASYCITHEAAEECSAPWFRDGKWLGRESINLASLASDERQFIDVNPPKLEKKDGVSPEQMFVTCLPSLGHTSLIWLAHALQLAGPVACARVLAMMIGREVAVARQRLVEYVLNLNPRPEYMFFYGDDNLPSATSLQLLFDTMKKENSSAISGLYAMKYAPPYQPLLWQDRKPGWMQPGRDFEMGDVVRCAGTGLDFCVIKTSVFEKMKKPYFTTNQEWIEGKGVRVSTEDVSFWNGFREATGEDVMVDTRARIGHYSEVDGRIY